MKLDVGLAGVRRLGIDTAPIIYLVEAHPTYDVLVRTIFQEISGGRIEGITSVITLGEVLVQPLRRGNEELRRRYRHQLLHSGGLATVRITAATAELAARLRATCGMLLPDAIQIAVALSQGCEAFLTNDRRLARVAELRVLVLDDLEL